MYYQIDKTKHLTDREIIDLKSNLLSSPINGIEKLCLELLLNTGARTSEVLKLTVQDFDFDSHIVFVRGIKGSSNRSVPVNEDLMKRLKANFGTENLHEKSRPFNFTDRHLRNLWYQVRPCNKPAHTLRHTYAIEIYKKFRDIRLVQYLLGHRNINNTLVYSNYVYTTEELTKISVGFRI